jgi:hypothetical protein
VFSVDLHGNYCYETPRLQPFHDFDKDGTYRKLQWHSQSDVDFVIASLLAFTVPLASVLVLADPVIASLLAFTVPLASVLALAFT